MEVPVRHHKEESIPKLNIVQSKYVATSLVAFCGTILAAIIWNQLLSFTSVKQFAFMSGIW